MIGRARLLIEEFKRDLSNNLFNGFFADSPIRANFKTVDDSLMNQVIDFGSMNP